MFILLSLLLILSHSKYVTNQKINNSIYQRKSIFFIHVILFHTFLHNFLWFLFISNREMPQNGNVIFWLCDCWCFQQGLYYKEEFLDCFPDLKQLDYRWLESDELLYVSGDFVLLSFTAIISLSYNREWELTVNNTTWRTALEETQQVVGKKVRVVTERRKWSKRKNIFNKPISKHS